MTNIDLHTFVVIFAAGASAGAQMLAFAFWLGRTGQEGDES